MFDEYLHIGETTAHECLKYFCQASFTCSGLGIFGSLSPRLPGSNGYARVGARISRHVGQHILDALGMEELPQRLERAVNDQLQKQESHDNPRSRS